MSVIFSRVSTWLGDCQTNNVKQFAPGEARTHGLQIMRLTRCLLRYGGWWKIVCQKWDLNPRPHTRTRILIHISSLSESKVHNYLESGALDHSAILTLVMREEIYSSLLCQKRGIEK